MHWLHLGDGDALGFVGCFVITQLRIAATTIIGFLASVATGREDLRRRKRDL
jgi:hypothetical protein